MRLSKFSIKNYRSIAGLEIDLQEGLPLILCGSNNVGKTNILRALNLFFHLDITKFDRLVDIPYDIAEGRSTGGRYSTKIHCYFQDAEDRFSIKTIFGWKRDSGNYLKISGKKNGKKMSDDETKRVVRGFRFLFIEASNINLPNVIAEVIDDEVLSLGLDTLKKKQTEPLKKLKNFVQSAKESLKDIERSITENVNNLVVDVPGIDTKGWKIQILFAEFNKLREALSGLIELTLYDKNKRKIESKGSGIQRIVLLSIMQYIADRSSKSKKIIWAIDEPEAFLQPTLQKKVFKTFKEVVSNQALLLTTHSQHFVDIDNVVNTHLVETISNEKEYAKKKDETFYKIETFINADYSELEKVNHIKKQLGIYRADGWTVMPYNFMVEGDEDKEYLSTLARKFDLEIPNILVAGGASKIKGYLQFISDFCDDLSFKPKILCIFDNDDAGKTEFRSFTKSISDNKYTKFDLLLKVVPRCDGKVVDFNDHEIEDLIYPEAIRQALNAFLKKQNYKGLSNGQMKMRFEPAYIKKCMLNFLTERVKALNSEKDEMNFENEGYKRVICQKACDYIRKADVTKLDNEYPAVKTFLTEICNSFNAPKKQKRKRRTKAEMLAVGATLPVSSSSNVDETIGAS